MEDWPRIVREYGPLVWQTICRLVGGDGDAADCYQETFLRAWRISRQDKVANWAGLLQRIATTRALDCLRHRGRRIRGVALGDNSDALAGGGREPSHRMENLELGEQLQWALAKLPARAAEIFCLRHLSDASYEEIAQGTGLSVNAVGVLLHRTRAKLRELMQPQQSQR